MNLTETAAVLAKAAAFDRRTVGEADILAWHEVLGDLPADDVLTAVTAHYREATDWLMPAHVRLHALSIDRERRRAARELREAEELQAAIAASPLHDRADDVTALIGQLRDRLPDGDPDKLRHGSKAWRLNRERMDRLERLQAAGPNPFYDPTALQRAAEMLAETEAGDAR
jgi:hypothetical protein